MLQNVLKLLSVLFSQICSPWEKVEWGTKLGGDEWNNWSSSTDSACMLSSFSCVQLFATQWTEAHQDPLSMGFSRQEYWSGLLYSPPGYLPNPAIEPTFLTSTWIGRLSLPLAPPGKPHWFWQLLTIKSWANDLPFPDLSTLTYKARMINIYIPETLGHAYEKMYMKTTSISLVGECFLHFIEFSTSFHPYHLIHLSERSVKSSS